MRLGLPPQITSVLNHVRLIRHLVSTQALIKILLQYFIRRQVPFKYRIGTLGTGNTTRLTSLDFTCPNLPEPQQNPNVPQDFSDAPAIYGNPVHDIVAGIRLGATNTAETVAYNHPNATGDAGDDGVVFSALTQGQPGSITASVSGIAGILQGWIDWNGDGDFADAGEQVVTNLLDNQTGDADPATGKIRIDFTVPTNAITTRTFARFRWSTQTGLPATTITARDGEVEDYPVTVIARKAILTISKTSLIYDQPGKATFAIPGNDAIYTITVTNIGNGPTDNNSVFIYDTLPSQVSFFNGDVDGTGPVAGPVIFTQNGAGLTYTDATALKFSNQLVAPVNFAACTYTPVAGYDPNIRYVCFNPKGAMLSGSPAPSFSVQFRTQIK